MAQAAESFAAIRRKQRRETYDSFRGTPAERGYDHQWQRLSRMIRNQRPVCEVCNNAASDDVDHIVPFNGITDPLRTDVSNLQAICRPCHARKTAGQQRQPGG